MRTLACLGILFSSLISLADDTTNELKTVLTERGKLLYSADFKAGLGEGWKVSKGKYDPSTDGVVVRELKEDMHGAVARKSLVFKNIVIQYTFKLDGAKMTSLSFNDAKNHVCRVAIAPNLLRVSKDDHDGKNGPDKGEVLDTNSVTFSTGEWHTVVIEIHGKEMIATVDGKHVAFGSHDLIETEKHNFGLTVSGESATFKDFRVWEASPNKNWETTKKELTEAKAKRAKK